MRRSLKASNADLGKMTSPRTSKRRGRGARHAEGNAADGPHVGSHVLADDAVAASRAAREEAVLVGQGNGQTVELELADHVELRLFQQVGDAGVPCQELLVVEGVAQAEERDRVLGLREPLQRLRADALGRRVGRDELGILGLDCRNSRIRSSYCASEISGSSRTKYRWLW